MARRLPPPVVRGPRALVIGGTGPTGPPVVEGLAERGYGVTIFHGGQHEVEFAVPGVRHIHADPHFSQTLEEGLGSETWDLVVAQYGRLRIVAEAMKGRTGRLVAIGGATALYGGDADERWGRLGRPALFPEQSEILVCDKGPDGSTKLGLRMVQALDSLMDAHASGAYDATYVMYPVNFGPRNPGPYDWAVIRRILDGRTRMVIADGGIKLESRVFSENAAQAVLLVVDNPEVSAGKRYAVADEYVFSMRQRIEFIARHMGVKLELVDLPYELAWPCQPLWRRERNHKLCQSTLIREELHFREATPVDVGFSRTIDWLIDNRPEPGGEAEQQVGDPFDYRSEDLLMDRWLAHAAAFEPVESTLLAAGHQYRHPKAAGDAWKAAERTPGSR